MKQLTAMSANGFEQACADLLARDGFVRARRVGGSGDLGADVVAWDVDGRKIVAQCKQYTAPVGSGAVQKCNGTARPEHGADVAVIVALNGFTKPATEFAERHDIALIGRPELKRWAHGEHLYAVVDEQHSPA
ncbi:restriction endonuclease [Streptomyces sp. NPDC088337]|uniref:restriction endonuclease n=1 Tax=unclassified Streptomyces TaxID=2593676 RepID=UPI002DDA6B49|nr:restriction endonuclease [Streptomyces sp. NBC_01788]WSB25568.1 restriction endonuclease [Streptomyces sp. NBC_01788]